MSIKVLAVDDSKTIRDLLNMALNDAGFETHLAEDGVAALELLEDISPNAVITDINMPNMDGFELVKEIRSQDRFARLPILVLTTESAPELKAKARIAGATGWVVKPFEPTKLVRAIQMVAG